MTDQTAIVQRTGIDAIEAVIATGDLAKLTPEQRVNFYSQTCRSLGLNPLTKPFEYLNLSGKLVLYARKDATEQLRKLNGVSIISLEREIVNDVYCVTAHARTADGRTDSSIGAVNIAGLKGDAIANAMMKTETKAKRRVTLSICGLGFLDETEIETIPNARIVEMNDPAPVAKVTRPAAEIVQELGYDPKPSSLMTLEMAATVTNSDGVKYTELSTEILAIMANSLDKVIKAGATKDGPLTPEQIEERKFKRDAAREIIKSRPQ